MGSVSLIHFCFAPLVGLVFFTILVEIAVGRIMKPVKLQNVSEQGHWIVDEIVKECYSCQESVWDRRTKNEERLPLFG